MKNIRTYFSGNVFNTNGNAYCTAIDGESLKDLYKVAQEVIKENFAEEYAAGDNFVIKNVYREMESTFPNIKIVVGGLRKRKITKKKLTKRDIKNLREEKCRILDEVANLNKRLNKLQKKGI